MAYIHLFQNEQWWHHSNYTYGYISTEYSHWREGTTQCYKINYSAGISSGSTYKNGINIYVILDGTAHAIGSGIGTNNSGSWYHEGSGTYYIANKTSGTTTFKTNVYDAKTNALLWSSPTYYLNVDNAYPTVTTNPYVTSRTINSLSFNIGGVDIASDVYWSLDNANWNHAVAQDVTIYNLSANTGYTIYVQYRNTADHSLSTTATCTGTTLPQALISSPGQGFTLNSNSGITIKCTNNSGCPVQYYLETYINGVSTAFGLTSSTTATSYTFSVDVVKTMLSKIPNVNSCTVRAVVATVINGNRAYYSFTSGTLKIVDSNPTFSNWTYEDVNSKTLALTGNNQIVVKGYSSIRGVITSANKATAKNYASMSKYRLTIGSTSKEATYSSSANVQTEAITASTNTFTMYAIDSRTNSTSVSKTVSSSNYKEYFNIAIDTSKSYVQRQNNGIGSNVTLNIEGKIWNANFGKVINSIKSFTVQYKLTTQGDESYKPITIGNPTITDNTFKVNASIQGDLGADGFTITSAFHIQIKIIDELSSSVYTMTLSSGTPNLAIHPDGVAINQPYDMSDDSALQIKGIASLSTSSGDAYYTAKRTDTGTEINFGVGSGGTNHGLWSKKLNKWMVYGDASNVYLNGNSASADKVYSSKQTFNRGSWNTPTAGLITQVTDNSGSQHSAIVGLKSDGKTRIYGIDLLDSDGSPNMRLYAGSKYIELNSTSNSITTGTGTLRPAKDLYNNTSGTNGGVTLSESAANFNYLEVFFSVNRGNQISYNSQKIQNPNGKDINLNAVVRDVGQGVMYMESTLYNISGTSMVWRIKGSSHNYTNSVGFYDSNTIYIFKVVGYR